MLSSKKIIVGVTGSIAAYKTPIFVRLLAKSGVNVQVVMTSAAKQFVTPLSLSTVSNKPVLSEFFNVDTNTWGNHIQTSVEADAMIIAPATACTISKMATGLSDNLLIAMYLAMRSPVFIAPAMDAEMYMHPSSMRNLDILAKDGVHILPPNDGELASGLSGQGRMREPEELHAHLDSFFKNNV